MTTAVKKVLRGKDREWNPNFERMCAHYSVEPTGCIPARGNGKGRVERQVRVMRVVKASYKTATMAEMKLMPSDEIIAV